MKAGRLQAPCFLQDCAGIQMVEVFIAAPLFAVAAILTGLVRDMAVRSQLLALPSSRGLHAMPTPVGGGIAIVLTYLFALAYVAITSEVPISNIVMLAAGLPVAVAGLLDDRSHVSAVHRLCIQSVCAVVAVWLATAVPPLRVGSVTFDGILFLWVILPVSLVWLANLYNFMDGIDGLAGGEAAFVSVAASAILFSAGDSALGLLCLGLFAGAAGFLVWNWPPARIFMGDVGSGFLGLTFGVIALLSHVHGSMSLWSWVLLLSCFIVDASATLLRRVVTGQPFHEAHRQHAFQHAAQRCGSHMKVTVAVLSINIFWLLPLAWLASLHPEHGVYFAAIGIVPLLALVHRFGAGRESL